MRFLGGLRSLVLGETWALPLGVGVAVLGAVLVRGIAGSNGWWQDAGGIVLLAGLVVALAVSVRRTG